jgi:drug/metabolite transporter (DMT)-like permease
VVILSVADASCNVWDKLACLGAALSSGFGGVRGRRFRRIGITPMTATFGQLACSTALIAPVWLFLDRPWTAPMPGLTPGLTSGLTSVLAVVGVAVLSTALDYLIFVRALAAAGTTNLALVTFPIPVSATMLGRT